MSPSHKSKPEGVETWAAPYTIRLKAKRETKETRALGSLFKKDFQRDGW